MNDFEKKIKGTVASKLFAFDCTGNVLYEKATGRRRKVFHCEAYWSEG
jgi:hypothetical protein